MIVKRQNNLPLKTERGKKQMLFNSVQSFTTTLFIVVLSYVILILLEDRAEERENNKK